MGQAIVLHDFKTGYRWYDYSVPGNIHYGYIGLAAGIPEWLLHLGASKAEITDPSHEVDVENVVGLWYANLHGDIAIDCIFELNVEYHWYQNFEWVGSLFDDPTDWNAIELGAKMYRAYPGNLSFYGLVKHLTLEGETLDQASNVPPWEFINTRSGGGWPYSASRFDGPDTDKNEPIIWGYLNP